DTIPPSAGLFTASGGDIDVPECQLEYDRATRRLTIGGGSRRDAKGTDALADVAAVVRDQGDISVRALKSELKDSEHGRAAIEGALRLGLKAGNLKQKD